MKNVVIPIRRPAAALSLMAVLFVLLAGCAGPQVKQGSRARIPDTSNQSTATAQVRQALSPGPGTQIAFPSPVVLPSESLAQPTQPASLYASPTEMPRPTATATPQLIKVDPACLVGTWQVADLPNAMAQSYAQSGSTLQLQNVEGQASYVFDPHGTMAIAFSHLAANFNGSVDNRDVTVRQGLDGSGTAHYQVNPVEGQVVFSDFGGQGLLSTLDINGQRIAEGNIPVWRAFTSSLTSDSNTPTSLVEYSRAAITCASKAMTIQAIEPFPGPVVNLTREK